MTSILVVTLDAGGNVPPALEIARRLDQDGARVTVLGAPAQAEVVVVP